MTDQPKEVKALLEALTAFEAIEDPAQRTTAVSRALRDWPTYHARLRELRQASVRELRDEQQKSWPEIAGIIGEVTPERAQQIGKGLRGTKRPPKKTDDTSAE